jgi:hypothetical protein
MLSWSSGDTAVAYISMYSTKGSDTYNHVLMQGSLLQ